jgi:hypothetical protein
VSRVSVTIDNTCLLDGVVPEIIQRRKDMIFHLDECLAASWEIQEGYGMSQSSTCKPEIRAKCAVWWVTSVMS